MTGSFQLGGEVHGLVEGASARCAVAEEAHGHVAAVPLLDGERRAGGDVEAAADHAVRAQHADAEVCEMHGAALALAVSGGAAVELGERTVDAGAFGEGVAVAAVGAGHVIVVGEVAAYAGGDGLLADVQVGGSDDLLADVRLDGFLEPADLAHGGVEVNGLLRGQWCAHDVRAFVCSLVCFLLDVGGAWARPDLCRALRGNRRGMAVSCMVRLTTCAAVLHGCHAGPYGRPA